MKIKLAAVMTDLFGKPIKNGEIDFLLSDVCMNALLSPDDEKEPEEKVRRYKLAVKCSNGKDPELSVEDIALLKKLIGRVYPPLIVGRAYEILDPEN